MILFAEQSVRSPLLSGEREAEGEGREGEKGMSWGLHGKEEGGESITIRGVGGRRGEKKGRARERGWMGWCVGWEVKESGKRGEGGSKGMI